MHACERLRMNPIVRSAQRRLPFLTSFLSVLVAAGVGCARLPRTDSAVRDTSIDLQRQLINLGERVDETEAANLAQVAIVEAKNLAREYQAAGPPWFHNMMVNGRLKKRGLCYHWTNDLFSRLNALGLRSLDLHLAVARRETSREHNAVVVTAGGQPFEHGLVLDAWRGSGTLFAGPVLGDKYPWKPLSSAE